MKNDSKKTNTKKSDSDQIAKTTYFSREDFYSEKTFILVTCILSFLLSLMYGWKGYQDGFSVGSYFIIIFNLLYIPFALIFKRKGFVYFCLTYMAVLIFTTAFHKTFLYNNFTPLFFAFVIYLIEPKLKHIVLSGYFVLISIAYILNEENLCHFFIHIIRAVWFVYISIFLVEKKYKRNKLILYEDEIKILSELSNHKLQKSIEFEGYSESTIYRRLKSAMTRNNLTKKELIDAFQKEYHK